MTSAQPFIGSVAVARASLTRHCLRTRYRAVLPDVYLPREETPTLAQRTASAWLWAGRDATIAGLAAAAMHGSRWVDDNTVVELVCQRSRSPSGVRARRCALTDRDTQWRHGVRITSPARTAFDIGRVATVDDAVARLDALAAATGVRAADISAIAQRNPGARGVRHLAAAVGLMDAGARSPRETWLRLLLIRGGLPAPQTQLPLYLGNRLVLLDMGWREARVAVEYDGDQHRTDRRQYVRDIRRSDALREYGWDVVRVVAEDGPGYVLQRVRRALARAGRRGGR